MFGWAKLHAVVLQPKTYDSAVEMFSKLLHNQMLFIKEYLKLALSRDQSIPTLPEWMESIA